jgi:hypothetical protein
MLISDSLGSYLGFDWYWRDAIGCVAVLSPGLPLAERIHSSRLGMNEAPIKASPTPTFRVNDHYKWLRFVPRVLRRNGGLKQRTPPAPLLLPSLSILESWVELIGAFARFISWGASGFLSVVYESFGRLRGVRLGLTGFFARCGNGLWWHSRAHLGIMPPDMAHPIIGRSVRCGQRSRFLWFLCCFLIAEVLSSQSRSMAEDLKLLVLDALDGKPQANVEVEYFCTGLPRNPAHTTTLTNNEGFAMISNFCTDKQEIEIAVSPTNKKEQCGVGPVTLKEILSVGVVAKPDADGGIWCPTEVSKKLKPVPGQVIMFVKKPTWWQSHVAG